MLDILMSVHQEWIVKMFSGEKTDELRKTWPKNIPTPFRVRLYCTQGRGPQMLLLDGKGDVCERCRGQEERAIRSGRRRRSGPSESEGTVMRKRQQEGATIGDWQNVLCGWQIGNGFVVGEFICPGRTIVKYPSDEEGFWWPRMAEISRTTCLSVEEICSYIGMGGTGSAWHVRDLKIYDKPMELDRFFMPAEHDGEWLCRVERAPQSWCYIEQIVKGVG